MFANGPFNTRDKLKNFWMNISLVSALLLSCTYSSAINPVGGEKKGEAEGKGKNGRTSSYLAPTTHALSNR